MDNPLETRRSTLLARGSLLWTHWLVVIASLGLTVAASYFAQRQIDQRIEDKFGVELDRVVGLVQERLQKYEDGLWGGVGAINAMDGAISEANWRIYVETLRLYEKYPGISGLGVVDYVASPDLTSYLQAQHSLRPSFDLHPKTQGPEHLPISYIVPTEPNRKAIGLDLAHEKNRYQAALQARDSGVAQVTAPIVLVQDAEKTPGFLFCVPFYRKGAISSLDDRRLRFAGLVYAPFVTKQLMAGTLSREGRHVAIRIEDNDSVLYDELSPAGPGIDPDPLFKAKRRLELYGRVWTFEVVSDQSFREAASSGQPLTILLCGLGIDSLLLLLFMFLSRANRRTIEYADLANHDLIVRTQELERSNRDLEQFAYISSHDLQEPLRMVTSYTALLNEDLEAALTKEQMKYMNYVIEGGERMQALIRDLLKYSRVGKGGRSFTSIDTNDAVNGALANLRIALDETSAEVSCGELPTISGDTIQLTQVFQNLIHNAVKFRGEESPRIDVRSEAQENGRWLFRVTDNGIGIDPGFADKVFQIFQRLHTRREYPGNGVGLAIAKRIVEQHGGLIWVESVPGQGSKFYFTLQGEGRD